MLVLSRKENEELLILNGPDEIVIRICRVDRGKVRIGIVAPQEYRVERKEKLDERMDHENCD